MRMAFELAANRANVCFIGTPTRELSFSVKEWENINRKEFTLTGSWMSYSAPFPGEEWKLAAHFMGTGELKVEDSFIYKIVPLTQIADAFEEFRRRGRSRARYSSTATLTEGRAVAKNPIIEMVEARARGERVGIPSYCTANALVIEALLEQGKRFDAPVLLEATANRSISSAATTGSSPAITAISCMRSPIAWAFRGKRSSSAAITSAR